MKAFGLSIDEASISVNRMLQAVNVFALDASELPQRSCGSPLRRMSAQDLDQARKAVSAVAGCDRAVEDRR